MFTPLSNAQAKQYIDATQIHEGLRDARAKAADYRGGMHWKKVRDREYLYRSLDRHGKARSLGPRSQETERIKDEWLRRKMDLTERLSSFRGLAETHARVNRALRLGSLPNEVADVCEQLEGADLMGRTMMVIGTNSMHAYEAMAGVKFASDIMSTVDIDLLWNHKTKLSLAATQEVGSEGLIGLLRRADKTYEIDKSNPFRARSQSGFMVDLIRQMPDPPWADEPDRFFQDDLVATDIKNMRWLLNAPRVTQPVVAVDGRVVNITAPDPRAFVIYKIWLSTAEDREPAKRGRDIAQARALIELIEERLPHLDRWGALGNFPAAVVDAAAHRVGREQWLRERDA